MKSSPNKQTTLQLSDGQVPTQNCKSTLLERSGPDTWVPDAGRHQIPAHAYSIYISTLYLSHTIQQKLARMSDHDNNLKIAHETENDLNTYQAKQGLGRKSDSTVKSGVNAMVDRKFGDTGIKIGREAGASSSDRKPIPEDEGGSRDDRGRISKAGQFQGSGGPEDKVKIESQRRPGDDDVLNLQEMKREGLARKIH
ncbi:hypothetical protein BA78_7591 [Aspergillus fumigatus]|nr:hypothetical protein BA78_7591 [Aspergillus fumigatus]